MTMLQPTGLRATLEDAGGSLNALTVLAIQNDPFRQDTPAGHRDGRWLRLTLDGLDVAGKRHLRGLHYILIGQPKPNGLPYTNTEADWNWLGNSALKAARWLGYIQFDQIIDQRNAAPEVRAYMPPTRPSLYVGVNFEVVLPDAEDLRPEVFASGFLGKQPNRIILVGEKSSLGEVLGPVANRFEGDLYLPTGDMSDTMLHTMAQSGTDGRPMKIFYFADCDPSGWNMPIAAARKLQAFKAALYPDLQFEVFRVGLTPDHVREYGLPSTPLKDTETRADKWQAAMGVQQTEIDALAALQPDLLRSIAIEAISPFYDSTLNRRVNVAREEWKAEAQVALDEQLGGDQLDQLREDAAARLDEKREEIDAILAQVDIDTDQFDFPERAVPVAEFDPNEVHPKPLCDSEWDFDDQCERLIASKNYEEK